MSMRMDLNHEYNIYKLNIIMNIVDYKDGRTIQKIWSAR